jgi:hypothetical protein
VLGGCDGRRTDRRAFLLFASSGIAVLGEERLEAVAGVVIGRSASSLVVRVPRSPNVSRGRPVPGGLEDALDFVIDGPGDEGAGGLDVAAPAELAGDGVDVHLAVGAQGDLGGAVEGLAEEDGDLGALDVAGVLGHAIEVIGIWRPSRGSRTRGTVIQVMGSSGSTSSPRGPAGAWRYAVEGHGGVEPPVAASGSTPRWMRSAAMAWVRDVVLENRNDPVSVSMAA